VSRLGLLDKRKVTVFGSRSGKDFMLEAVDVLKGVSSAIEHFD